MAKPNWITLDKTTGTGNGTFNATAPEYTGRNKRSGTITATTGGGSSDTSVAEQQGKAEFIELGQVEQQNPGATGGTYIIKGTSNSANLNIVPTEGGAGAVTGVAYTIYIDGAKTPDSDWNGGDNTGIDGDPGAEAQYAFEIHAQFPANTSESERKHEITLQNGNGTVKSDPISITQAAGSKTYGEIVISSFTYADVSAKGSPAVVPVVSYTQSWGWNGSTTGGGTLNAGATLLFATGEEPSGITINASSGALSAASKGTDLSDRTKLCDVTVTVTLNGKSATKSAEVYQQENKVTGYGDITFNDVLPEDIPASGGSVSSVADLLAYQTATYTSGATKQLSSGTFTWSPAVSAQSLGTTAKERTAMETKLVATVTMEADKSATKEFTVYQAANEITQYGDITFGGKTTADVQSAAGSYAIDPKAAQIITYTSGGTRNGVVSCTYSIKDSSAIEGVSLKDNTVTYPVNGGVDNRELATIVISATGEGDKTASMELVLRQQGADSSIALTPETLTFEADGGTKEVTVESNDSWTIS